MSDLLTAGLFSITQQGWCRAAVGLIDCVVPVSLGKLGEAIS